MLRNVTTKPRSPTKRTAYTCSVRPRPSTCPTWRRVIASSTDSEVDDDEAGSTSVSFVPVVVTTRR